MATTLNNDAARRWTDAELDALERNMRREYRQAAKEMRGKQAEWLKGFNTEREQREKALDTTKEAMEAHERWLQSQAARGDWLGKMATQLAESAHQANVRAMDMVNGHIPHVFAENANRAAFDVDKALRADTGFTLVNEEAVRHVMEAGVFDTQLIKEVVPDAPELGPAAIQSLRKREVDYPKDMRWNRRKFTSAITQGILQGESIPNIVKRTESIYGQNRNAAIRAARTATTNAENAGRMNSFERAQRLGIDMEIEWEATLDGRTRSSHRRLDGERIQLGEYFESEHGPIRWPGDSQAHPAEVWNCFVGETCAIPLGGIERSFRRFYEGDAVTVRTARGIEFTCTPNHPILTSKGWVAAGLLDKGYDLFVAGIRDNRATVINPNVQHIGTRMDAIHELSTVLPGDRATGLKVYFHEDVFASNVDVVTQERPLRVNTETFRLEPIDELGLETPDALTSSNSAEVQLLSASMATSNSLMGGSGEPGTLLWGSISHALEHGLRTVPGSDSGAFESYVYDTSTDSEVLRESLDALSFIVEIDHIIDVDIHPVATHVYNLQTQSGAYLVGYNGSNGLGIFAHNCRCRADGRVVGFDGKRGDWADEAGERWSRLPEGTTYEEWKAAKAVTRDDSYRNDWTRVPGAWYAGSMAENMTQLQKVPAPFDFDSYDEGEAITSREAIIESLPTEMRESEIYDYDYGHVSEAEYAVRTMANYTTDNWEKYRYDGYLEKAIQESSEQYKGAMFRGMRMPRYQVEQFEPGGTITPNGVQSWTRDHLTALDYCDMRSGGDAVVLVDVTEGKHTAISIEAVSQYYGEKEVLSSGRVEYEIIRKYEKEFEHFSLRRDEPTLRTTVVEVRERRG